MAFTTTACPCGDYTGDFSDSTNCGESQTAGHSETALIVCHDKVATLTTVACDAAVANGGMVTELTLNTGESAAKYFAKCKSILDTSTLTFDEEACTTTVNETIISKGRTDNQTMCFLRSYIGKPAYKIICGKDGQVKMYDGIVQEVVHTGGAKSGDFIGVDVTFLNTANDPFKYFDMAVNYGDSADTFFTEITTPAP
jgi:hypothetical protein